MANIETNLELEDFYTALASSSVAMWSWDLSKDIVITDPTLCKWFGIDPENSSKGLPLEEFINSIYQIDQRHVQERIDQAIKGNGSYEAYYRVVDRDKNLRWVVARGTVIKDQEGKPFKISGVLIDITSSRQIEEDLEVVRQAVESSTNGVVIANAIEKDNPIIYANQAFYKLTGYSKEEVIGKNCRFLQGKDTNPKVVQQIREAIKNQTTCKVIIENYKKDGTVFWNELSISPVYNGNEDTRFFVGIQNDITERININQKLKDNETQLKLITDSIPDLVSYIDTSERYRFANKAYSDWVDFKQKDILGKNVKEVFGEKVYDYSKTFMQRALKGERFSYENSLIDKNGDQRHLEVRYIPDIDEDGNVKGFVALSHDMTEIKKSQERLHLAQKAGNIGTFEWFIKLKKLIWNSELEELYGFEPGGFKGEFANWERTILPEDKEKAKQDLLEAVKNATPYISEFRIRTQNGDIKWLLSKGEVYYDEDKQPERVVGINIDITELKEAEEEIKELNNELEQRVNERTKELTILNKELERSNGELQDFAYVASHDLQEPLRKIMAFSNLLTTDTKDLSDEAKEFVRIIQKGAKRMSTLINDLLNYSRVTTKAQPFVDVDLDSTIKEVLEDLEIQIDQTKAKIKYENLGQIEADPLQIRLLLQNLISNAIKYRKEDTIPEIEVTAERDEEFLTLKVKDNGIGFDEAFLDKIFIIFQRLHGKDAYEGTGIGLAICKKIVERHGGNITAKSKLGSGSIFIVKLPIKH